MYELVTQKSSTLHRSGENMTSGQTQLIIKKVDSKLSHQQKTFNRLIKTVQDLQSQQGTINRDLDLALQFYHATIKPDEAVLWLHHKQRLCLAYQWFKNNQKFKQHELKIIKLCLLEEVEELCPVLAEFNIPADELKEIFK